MASSEPRGLSAAGALGGTGYFRDPKSAGKQPVGAYCCPDCRTPLENLYCGKCHAEYPVFEGIPRFFPRRAEFRRARQIAADYDSIYRSNPRVWRALGRESKEFIDYFSSLVERFQSKRLLEIGCGEGFLLAALNADEKFAVDISAEAIKAARARTRAECSVAVAEGLPYAAEYFDLIMSVGVMEHFLDADKALREINRVLKGGGHYINLVHVRLTLWDRLTAKWLKLFFPRPRPLRFLRWSRAKLNSGRKDKQPAAIRQPIQNKYTTRSGRACLEKNGFKVIDVIHTRKDPGLPLKGPFVVIYIGQK